MRVLYHPETGRSTWSLGPGSWCLVRSLVLGPFLGPWSVAWSLVLGPQFMPGPMSLVRVGDGIQRTRGLWTKDHRMDQGPQDGPRTTGRTKDHRTDQGPQDGPSTKH